MAADGKRGAEEEPSPTSEGQPGGKPEEPKRKRSRFGAPANALPPGDAATAGAGGAATGAAKPALPKLDVLEKAKKALQLQKELKAKLAKLPTMPKPAAAALAAPVVPPTAPPPMAPPPTAPPPAAKLSSAAGKGPAPLILDASGREVDAEGKPLERRTKAVSTFKVNLADRPKPKSAEDAGAEAGAEGAEEEAEADAVDIGYDPRMGDKGLRRMERRPRGFKFVEEGKLSRQAELARVRNKYGDKAFRQMQERQERERREARMAAQMNLDANAMPLGERATAHSQAEKEKVPDVEWWDAGLLPSGTYDDVTEEGVQVKEGRLTIYVEHPVPIEPPTEAAMPAPQPLKLTKRELKKLRTQKRRQREMEKQELIRQGLLEPAKPKVKISNLMRVLGNESTADPTAIEKEVRAQMEERQMAHDDRNLSRKLTPAERKEKKIKKLFGDPDAVTGTQVCVFRVEDLTFKQHIYKVDINAQENRLTGTQVIVEDGFSLVVVEGTAKAIKRFNKLMLNRIDWNARGEEEEEGERPENRCILVWQGEVAEPAFEKFTKEVCSSKPTAKKVLAAAGVAHYWDLAENWVSETGI
eukprot:jgi/Tetstr1/459607/TSEL_004970.t1